MSLHEELLTGIYNIYETEADVSWHINENPFSKAPVNEWQAADGSLRFEDANFMMSRGSVVDIYGATIWIPAQDIALRVERRLEAAHYEVESLREDFLVPMEDYLRVHDHAICLQALVNRVYDVAKKENELFDISEVPLQERVSEPIKATDKRVRISLNV